MTEEERLEEQRLVNQIARLRREISNAIRENEILKAELENIIESIYVIVDRAKHMDQAVNEDMGLLAGKVNEADIGASQLHEALAELTRSYFTFKNLSTASKNLTQMNDEFYTRYSYYHEIRRITLGYVIGVDQHICSSETLRKKVEKAYLQNTEYWLAYCIAATMLWASDEKEAAARAIGKGLMLNFLNASLYFLLINLRFSRTEAAKKWYLNYLERTDADNLGNEWQYLLQAYLSGAFGMDKQFEELVANRFSDMLSVIGTFHSDFNRRVTEKAREYAQTYLHTTGQAFDVLQKTCTGYQELKNLLSDAEKTAVIARCFAQLAENEDASDEELPQRIENVLYSLISDYDEDEKKLHRNIEYNEMVVSAKGDINAAQIRYKALYAGEKFPKNLGDLLNAWAFSEDETLAPSVKKFSISKLKEFIKKGFQQFIDAYRGMEKDKVTINIDGCEMLCNEDGYPEAEKELAQYYEKTKLKEYMHDTQTIIYVFICLAALLTLVITALAFNEVTLVIGILLALAGSFLLWRRIVDFGKILRTKWKQGFRKLKETLVQLGEWRNAYKEADAKADSMIEAIERF